jgi:hypothetical protein
VFRVRNYVNPFGDDWQWVWVQGRTRVEVPRDATRAEVNQALDVAWRLTLLGPLYRPADRSRWRVRRGRRHS